MKKKVATTTRTSVTKTKPDSLVPLIAEIRQLVQSARVECARSLIPFK